MLKKYPKVQQLGSRYTKNIYEDEVEISEKLDGSQFRWGLVDGHLVCCSKGAVIDIDKPDGLFKPAVEHCKSIESNLEEGFVYIGETLSKPKHNTLKYNRVPKNNIALFAVYGISKDRWLSHSNIITIADKLHVDYVKLLFNGIVASEKVLEWTNWYDKLLDNKSQLGGSKIEGFVVKNLHREVMVGDIPIPFIQGKFVSERFKEKHGATYKNKFSNKGQWDIFKELYRTEARWAKSVQHLREEGRLSDSPTDIGAIITSVKEDITEECKEEICRFLWRKFGSELLRASTRGLPEWYKKQLLISEGNSCNDLFRKGEI